MIGMPMMMLSGPRENKYNYSLILSPFIRKAAVNYNFKNKNSLELGYKFNVRKYFVNNNQFTEDDSLFIEDNTFSLAYKHSLLKKFKITLSLGHKFDRSFYKAESLFDGNKNRFDLEKSNYLKVEFSFFGRPRHKK